VRPIVRARHFVQNAAERAIHRAGSLDASDGLLLVFIVIALAFWALYALGRQELRERRGVPAWLRERLKLPRKLTPIGAPTRPTRSEAHTSGTGSGGHYAP
jgi:hypothetical protein